MRGLRALSWLAITASGLTYVVAESDTCGTDYGVFQSVSDDLIVCFESARVISIVVGNEAKSQCEVCTGRAFNDCANCVTVVGPCACQITVPTTTTVVEGGKTTVLILTPTNIMSISTASNYGSHTTVSASTVMGSVVPASSSTSVSSGTSTTSAPSTFATAGFPPRV